MPDTLPPSVPTGSARAARTAGKKLEFAREYCSRRAVPIRLISRHALSLGTTRELRRIRTHKKRNRKSLKWIAVSGPMRRQQITKLATREWPLSAQPCRWRRSRRRTGIHPSEPFRTRTAENSLGSPNLTFDASPELALV